MKTGRFNSLNHVLLYFIFQNSEETCWNYYAEFQVLTWSRALFDVRSKTELTPSFQAETVQKCHCDSKAKIVKIKDKRLHKRLPLKQSFSLIFNTTFNNDGCLGWYEFYEKSADKFRVNISTRAYLLKR